jgi:hypothetical protein
VLENELGEELKNTLTLEVGLALMLSEFHVLTNVIFKHDTYM